MAQNMNSGHAHKTRSRKVVLRAVKPTDTRNVTVLPEVWAAALAIASGDYRRLDIVNESTVIVRNWRVR